MTQNDANLQPSMGGQNTQILIVEDDQRLAELTAEYLKKQGFSVAIETHGEAAVTRITEEQPDLVILDIMLPGKDGLTICREVRSHYNGQMLMLTAREDEMDQIVGLELGADDYLVKPVAPRLLLARIRNLLRRKNQSEQTDLETGRLVIGGLEIDETARRVFLDEEEVKCSTNEFDMLQLLAANAGTILSRDDILQKLRGIEYDGLDRSVDVGISRLRKKLADDGPEPYRLKTVRGQGYLLVPDAW